MSKSPFRNSASSTPRNVELVIEPGDPLYEALARFLPLINESVARVADWIARYRLRTLESMWREKLNPLAPWAAYGEARRAGLPIPEWVHSYLEETSNQLMRMIEAAPDRSATAIVEALRMKHGAGGASYFKQYREWERKVRAVTRVIELVAADHGERVPAKLSPYFQQVAREERKHWKTIAGWFAELAEILRAAS